MTMRISGQIGVFMVAPWESFRCKPTRRMNLTPRIFDLPMSRVFRSDRHAVGPKNPRSGEKALARCPAQSDMLGLYRPHPHQAGDLRIVKSQLDQDFAAVLAQLRHAAAQAPAARSVGMHRKEGKALAAARHGSAARADLFEVHGLRRSQAAVDRHVVLLSHPNPLLL